MRSRGTGAPEAQDGAAHGSEKKSARARSAPLRRYQFLRSGDSLLAAKGGRGGLGPQSFKKADGRKGEQGQAARCEPGFYTSSGASNCIDRSLIQGITVFTHHNGPFIAVSLCNCIYLHLNSYTCK